MKTITDLYTELSALGEHKARHGLAMSRPEYAKLEAKEQALRDELRRRLDAGEGTAA
jgi:hypothetical protein